MNNTKNLLDRLKTKTTDKEKYDFVNQQLTFCYMNGIEDDWVSIFSTPELEKYVDIKFKNGANFEYAFSNSKKTSLNKFSHLLLWLERKNLIDHVSSENINNCLLASTLVTYENVETFKKRNRKLELIYENNTFVSKIDISHADYGIFINLSDMKNKLIIDFLIDKHFKEILSDNGLHERLLELNRKNFYTYLQEKSLRKLLEEQNKNKSIDITTEKKPKI